jgi:chromosome partitioning protein
VTDDPEEGASLQAARGGAASDSQAEVEGPEHPEGWALQAVVPPGADVAAQDGGGSEADPRGMDRGGAPGSTLGVAMSEVWEGAMPDHAPPGADPGADRGEEETFDGGEVGPGAAAPGPASEILDQPEEPSALRVARVIAIANQKGGVGKSTTAVSLGAALADLGHDVLVVDLDPQGNASTGLGIRHVARDITTYEILMAAAPLEDAIVPTSVERLAAIPSTIDLAGAEIELVSQFSREMRLAKALEPVRAGRYDFILLDCPPSLGLLTINALAAADELLVPIQCEYYALEGLGQLLRNVRLIQQNVNSKLRLTGIVMTMYDARTKLSDQVVAEVRRYFGSRVYESVIPRTVRLSEAPGFGLPITAYDPLNRGAIMYRSLAREVASRPPEGEPVPLVGDLPEVITSEPRPLSGPDGRDPDAPPESRRRFRLFRKGGQE